MPIFPSLADFGGVLTDFLPRDPDNDFPKIKFASIDESRRFLSKLAPHVSKFREDYTQSSFEDYAKSIEEEVRPCILYLRNQEKSKEVLSLLRDALLLYHRARGSQYSPYSEASEHRVRFLFLLRFWDSGSVLKSDYDDRCAIYASLLCAHLPPRDKNKEWDDWTYVHAILPLSYVFCPENCLKSFFSCLRIANPALLLEAISWLGDKAGHLENIQHLGECQEDILEYVTRETIETELKIYDAIKEQDEQGNPVHVPYLELLHDGITDALLDLDLSGSELLLHTFGPIGETEREVLLRIYRMVEARAGEFRTCAASDLELHDIASALSNLATVIRYGRLSPHPIDKIRHLQRSLGRSADLREELTALEAKEGTRLLKMRSDLRIALEETEKAIRSAMAALPRTPLVLDKGERLQTYYFAFLIDHENFWGALADWVKKNRSDLNRPKYVYEDKYKNIRQDVGMFDEIRWIEVGENNEKKQKRDSFYRRYPNWYKRENGEFIPFVVSKLQDAWKDFCGGPDWKHAYAKAFGFWRFFSSLQADIYRDFGIHPLEPPSRPYVKEAVDGEIRNHMRTVARLAKDQSKKPYFVLVSGDSGYLHTLNNFHETEGAEFQYWCFRSQLLAKSVRDLPWDRFVPLESILRLEGFSFENVRKMSVEERTDQQAFNQ